MRPARAKVNTRKSEVPTPAKWRSHMVLLLFAFGAVGLIARAFYLQVVDQEFLTGQGSQRYVHNIEIPALRGAIYDRNEEPLALSAPTYTIWAVPGEVLSAPQELDALATALGQNVNKLKARLEQYKSRQFLYLARQIPPSQADQVMALGVPGVAKNRDFKRYYPAGEAAAQIVGLTNIDDQGQLGMEYALNEFLTGSGGHRQVITDSHKRVIEDLDGFIKPRPGQHLQLTISRHMQYAVYRELKKSVVDNEAVSGIAVVVDPTTGELLAIASYPSFNPNNRANIQPEAMRARAITDNFEPGSAIKPILLAWALETGEFTTKSKIDPEGGVLQRGSLIVRDPIDYGLEDFAKILRKSSNVGAAKVGLELGANEVRRGYANFGLGTTTGISFTGETSGNLPSAYHWGQARTATASYGYGVSVSALQLVRAYAAVANGGWLRPLKLIRGEGGHMQPPAEHVISEQTARDIREMLAGVVSAKGTAVRADIAGYSEGGKTGTARKYIDGQYSQTAHQAVFVGMAPIENPKLVTLVLIDQPKAGSYYAGQVAAPAFANIMEQALRIYGVPPTQPDHLARKKTAWEVSS